MSGVNPFALPGRWYKGNLHAHTTNSDGSLPPEEAVARYHAAGYDFLALTDHWRITETAPPASGFLLLLGTELDGGASEIGDTFHLVGVGLEEGVALPSYGATVPEMLAWIDAHGGVSVLAHPYWSGQTYCDLLPWEGPIGIEVFNTVCEHMIAKGHSSVQWDDLLSRGRCWWGLAVDDCHSERSATFAAVMVKATALTREAILQALRKGEFYSTNGPLIEEVAWSEDELRVRTSPVQEISFMGRGASGRRNRAAAGESICEAAYKVGEGERYVRIECCDAQGRRAWTNPVVFRGG